MIKLDLHTHSEASKDGGITPEEYAKMLREEMLDVVAITDHNRIDFALGMQKALGREKIIVGEEIDAKEGEIVGLYLREVVEPGMSAQDTIDAIKAQNGLVYIPHPFETVRKGLPQDVLEAIRTDVDIVEGCNGRAVFQNFGPQATAWARQHQLPIAASSDAHGFKGIGHTYTSVSRQPTQETLLAELRAARLVCKQPPLQTLLYPKLNRLKQLLKGQG